MQDLIPLQYEKINYDVHIFNELTSTNDYLKTFKPMNKKCICIAEQQTAGRGQFNRSWYSQKYKNILLSIRYPMIEKIANLSCISLISAIAVCRALRKVENLQYRIKWPNDIIINKKKICGILVETHYVDSLINFVIIGIGINVNMEHHSEPINAWTSLKRETKKTYDRNIICNELIAQMDQALQKFQKNGFQDFIPTWNRLDGLYKKNISVTYNKRIFNGIGHGVNTHGQLQLLINNQLFFFSCGEVSLKLR